MPESKTKLMTIDDVAEYLQIKSYTVRYKVRNNEIPGFFKIGREWRIKSEDLESWFEAQKKRQIIGGVQNEREQ
jgi:excisionase family DNA binding protein